MCFEALAFEILKQFLSVFQNEIPVYFAGAITFLTEFC